MPSFASCGPEQRREGLPLELVRRREVRLGPAPDDALRLRDRDRALRRRSSRACARACGEQLRRPAATSRTRPIAFALRGVELVAGEHELRARA